MSIFELQIDVSIIIVNDGKVLLMQRPADDFNFPLCWGIPGGGFEPSDKSLEAAGTREVYEEVGVSVKNFRFIANNYQPEGNILFVVFAADYENGEIKIDPSEVMQAGWFDATGLAGKLFTPTTEGLIRQVLN